MAWHLAQAASSPKNSLRPRAQLPPASSGGRAATNSSVSVLSLVSAHGTSIRRKGNGRGRESSFVVQCTVKPAGPPRVVKRTSNGIVLFRSGRSVNDVPFSGDCGAGLIGATSSSLFGDANATDTVSGGYS